MENAVLRHVIALALQRDHVLHQLGPIGRLLEAVLVVEIAAIVDPAEIVVVGVPVIVPVDREEDARAPLVLLDDLVQRCELAFAGQENDVADEEQGTDVIGPAGLDAGLQLLESPADRNRVDLHLDAGFLLVLRGGNPHRPHAFDGGFAVEEANLLLRGIDEGRRKAERRRAPGNADRLDYGTARDRLARRNTRLGNRLFR